MKTKKIIPCLDVKDGRTVKGVNFVDIKDAGDIIELATKYESEGADELVLLDITATTEDRSTTLAWISKVAAAINIPFTIGGGIRSVEDAALLLSMGASKVSINSAAVSEPELINEIAEQIGSESLVVAIDAKEMDGRWEVVVSGGNKETGRELVEWAKEVEKRGAGEILFTSMSHDGMQTGFPIEALKRLTDAVSIPITASGGAGKMEDFYDAFAKGNVASALAASVFHFGTISIPELKKYLKEKDIDVNI